MEERMEKQHLKYPVYPGTFISAYSHVHPLKLYFTVYIRIKETLDFEDKLQGFTFVTETL